MVLGATAGVELTESTSTSQTHNPAGEAARAVTGRRTSLRFKESFTRRIEAYTPPSVNPARFTPNSRVTRPEAGTATAKEPSAPIGVSTYALEAVENVRCTKATAPSTAGCPGGFSLDASS